MVSDLNTGVREKFISSAQNSKILVKRCDECNTLQLATVMYCENCHSNKLSLQEYDGTGTVTTFTIHTVPPEGFDDVDSYAWVVFTLDSAPLRASGFLVNIEKPADLPIGSKIQVTGFNEKHGLLLKKV